jgi:transposase-like protein
MRNFEISDGVALKLYLPPIRAGVRFSCRACQKHRDVPLQTVIRDLDALGLDGQAVGVRAVARILRRACPRCRSRDVETRPAFEVTSGGP